MSKSKNYKYLTEVKGGDPGYGETSKFISELALAIILIINLIIQMGLFHQLNAEVKFFRKINKFKHKVFI